jgi:hypothetical protein
MSRVKGYQRDELFRRASRPFGESARVTEFGSECLVCGRFIRRSGSSCSNDVLAQSSHMKMHLRNGELTEKLRVRVVKIHETVYVPTSDLIAEPARRRL